MPVAIKNAINDIKKNMGKNSVLRGLNYLESATMRERNKMIGGHNAGEDE